MKLMTTHVLAALAVMALTPTMVLAQGAQNQGYAIDPRGAIVMSGTGLCWRDSDWTPARSVEPCDPSALRVVEVPAAPAAPAPVAAYVAPIAAPAPARAQKISFSADALFAFDKATLKPEGRAMLDGLVRQLKGANDEGIALTGHTDRIGSNDYNQKLSVRRAIAVKEYLVAMGIPAPLIDAEGKGETQPETRPGDCMGAKSAKVIACLQPDRRVDVEMRGSKTIAGTR